VYYQHATKNSSMQLKGTYCCSYREVYKKGIKNQEETINKRIKN
jgi:hypothetical protein